MRAAGVGDGGGMHRDRQRPAHHIYREVALAPLDLFARVEAPLPPFCAVLTDWLSIMASVGSGLRPALTRTALPS
jgi:hypothetical protein